MNGKILSYTFTEIKLISEQHPSGRNIASIAKSCPEHISWLSMCQFVFTEICDKNYVTKENVTKKIVKKK